MPPPGKDINLDSERNRTRLQERVLSFQVHCVTGPGSHSWELNDQGQELEFGDGDFGFRSVAAAGSAPHSADCSRRAVLVAGRV